MIKIPRDLKPLKTASLIGAALALPIAFAPPFPAVIPTAAGGFVFPPLNAYLSLLLVFAVWGVLVSAARRVREATLRNHDPKTFDRRGLFLKIAFTIVSGLTLLLFLQYLQPQVGNEHFFFVLICLAFFAMSELYKQRRNVLLQALCVGICWTAISYLGLTLFQPTTFFALPAFLWQPFPVAAGIGFLMAANQGFTGLAALEGETSPLKTDPLRKLFSAFLLLSPASIMILLIAGEVPRHFALAAITPLVARGLLERISTEPLQKTSEQVTIFAIFHLLVLNLVGWY